MKHFALIVVISTLLAGSAEAIQRKYKWNPCQLLLSLPGEYYREYQEHKESEVKKTASLIWSLQKASLQPFIESVNQDIQQVPRSKVLERLAELTAANRIAPPTPYMANIYKSKPEEAKQNSPSLFYEWLISYSESRSQIDNTFFEKHFPELLPIKAELAGIPAEDRRVLRHLILDNTSAVAWAKGNIHHSFKQTLKLARNFDSYIWSQSNTFGPQEIFEVLITPIGSYGNELATNLLRTTQVMLSLVLEYGEDKAIELFESDPMFFTRLTTRGNNPLGYQLFTRSETQRLRSPLQSLMEGTMTIHQALANLTSQTVGELKDIELLRRIIFPETSSTQNGLLVKFARVMPLAITGPFNVSGYYFDNVVQDKDGMLQLNPMVLRALTQHKKVQRESIWKRMSGSNKERPLVGLGCPFAHGNCQEEKTAIQKLAEQYFRIFTIVSAHQKD